MKLIDGKALAIKIKFDVQTRVARMKAAGRPIRLASVLIGSSDAGKMYAHRQADDCRSVGIEYELITLAPDIDRKRAEDIIRSLNSDPRVTGIMLHLPVPSHLDATELQYIIDPRKDVEGVNPANIGHVVYGHTLIAPCTALAVIELIKTTGVPLRGSEAVVVGASQIAGKPISLLLTEQMATVTLCHIATRDLASHTRQADILIVAAGKPGLITASHVRDGSVVIDVGINRVRLNESYVTTGDVLFNEVSKKAGYITPVPGGVGPVTVAMLLQNTARSAELINI